MQVLYEDARILVCLKPSGVLSTDEEGGMPQRLRDYLGSQTACVLTVHRLDAAVSGVMVFARSHKAASLLSEQIRSGAFRKEYLAVLDGHLPSREGILEDYLLHDRYARKTAVCTADTPGAQKAVLSYRVLSQTEDASLVHIALQTGRTHQIRVQFASRGCPVWGDKKYGSGTQNAPIALLSYRLSFLHPQSNTPVCFSCDVPNELPWAAFETRCLP